MKRLLEEDAPNQATEYERMLLGSIAMDVPPEGAEAALFDRLDRAHIEALPQPNRRLRTVTWLMLLAATFTLFALARKRTEAPVPIVQETPRSAEAPRMTPVSSVVPAMEMPLPAPSVAKTTSPVPTVSSVKRPARSTPAPAPALSTLLRQASRDASTSNVGQEFDRGAVASALGHVNLDDCSSYSGPSGSGHVTVTFATDGHAQHVTVDPPFAGTPRGGCVAGKFAAVQVPPFQGDVVRVGKSFTLQ